MKIILWVGLTLFSYRALASGLKISEKAVGAAHIKFVGAEESRYARKVDYAELERVAPLEAASLAGLKAADFTALSEEEFNQIYARLDSGAMPLGEYRGLVLQKSAVFATVKEQMLKQVSALGEVAALLKKVCSPVTEDCLFSSVWKGKRFLPKNEMGQVEGLTLLGTGETLFPMNAYCGISQVDTRKEVIVNDGNFADDFPGFNPRRDQIVTRKGLAITEEYRRVRPGLYIGKVYSNKFFLFNLALEKTSADFESGEPCREAGKNK